VRDRLDCGRRAPAVAGQAAGARPGKVGPPGRAAAAVRVYARGARSQPVQCRRCCGQRWRAGAPLHRRSTLTSDGGQLHDPAGTGGAARRQSPTIYVDRAGEALPEIAKTVRNAVRLFLVGNMGVPISAAEPAIRRATELGMISILELMH